MKKEGFVLYSSQYLSVKHLPLDEKGRLLDAIFHYHITGEELPDLSPAVLMAFSFIRVQIDTDTEKYYSSIVERNRNNGKKGGRPKKDIEQQKPNGLFENPNNPDEPKKADKDKDKDKVIKEKIKQKEKCLQEQIKPFVEKYGPDMCNAFYLYWTEPNQTKTKLRYELEKTWDVARRLATWAKNNKNFNRKNDEERANIDI